jgi:ubiquinone/menaquinone biosynthesis C-methylase UbiE
MNLSKVITNLKSKKIVNYNKYLRSVGNLDELEIIKHSYDLQAGSYIKFFLKNKDLERKNCDEIADIIKKNFGKFESFLDCGCGEMTRGSSLIERLSFIKRFILFDISLNRMVMCKNFLKKYLKKINFKKTNFFCSSLDSIPLNDNSINLVFTNHAIEPNKNNAKKIIKELYRITNYGLMLNEPDYTSASKEQKKKMIKNNYVKNIPKILKQLGIKFKRVVMQNSIDTHNKTTSFIIFKKKNKSNKIEFVDPFYKKKIEKKKLFYFSHILGQVYFVFKNIPIFDFERPTIINNTIVGD